MAIVKGFIRAAGSVRLQPTQVVCRYRSADVSAGNRILQPDTYGSDDREMPGKVSQTIQLDENGARELWELLGREFGFS